jgi:hypothetical protein
MDKKHTIDGAGPRSADVLVCGLRRLLVAASRRVISRTTRSLKHGTGKSREPIGWKACATWPASRGADILVCGFTELSSSEFPPPAVAASLVSAANQSRTLNVERCMLHVACSFPLTPAPRPLTSGTSGRSPVRVIRGKNPVKHKEAQRNTKKHIKK